MRYQDGKNFPKDSRRLEQGTNLSEGCPGIAERWMDQEGEGEYFLQNRWMMVRYFGGVKLPVTSVLCLACLLVQGKLS